MAKDLETGYWSVSRRPIQILVFLLPLIAVYEFSLLVVLRQDDGVLSNLAHIELLRFFEAFGVPRTSGLYVGGLLIVLVLLTWHVLNRDRWTVKPLALLYMAGESAALTAPLIVLDQVIGDFVTPAMVLTNNGATTLAEVDAMGRVAISVGAGLYEELVFRMMLIAVLHTLLVSALKFPESVGISLAVLLSAVAFTLYHPVRGVPTSVIAFYFLAGVYFGVLFVGRGFGIVVGVHATYDIITVLGFDS